MPENKSYAQNWGDQAAKKIQKFEILFFYIFPYRLSFSLHGKI